MDQLTFSNVQCYCEESSASTQQYNPFELQLEPLEPSYSFDESDTSFSSSLSQKEPQRQRNFLMKVDGRPLYIQSKAQLKEYLLQIIECHHLESVMDKFSLELWNCSPWSVCVLIAEQLWDHLQKSRQDLWLSTWMIEASLLKIKPQRIPKKEQKTYKLAKLLNGSIY